MELSKTQEQIVQTEKRKVHVIAAAASGKTRLIVARIQYLLDKGIKPSEIVAITFTNNAANEMYERLGRPDGLFIGTVHSYCNYLLRSEGIDTQDYIDEEKFDELFELFKQNPQCKRHIKHLIIDEFQDSSPAQVDFFELLEPKNYMYCYDPRQAIYGFDKGDIDYVLRTQYEPGVTIYEMYENYRNNNNVLNFAKNLLYNLGAEYQDDSITMSVEDGYVYHTKWSYFNIVNKFLEDDIVYGDWFVLGRANREVDAICHQFEENGIPYTTFKQGSKTRAEIEEEVNSNKVKVLTIHSAKGLESPNVLVINAPNYYKDDEERRIYYVAATRAKNYLYWNKLPNPKKKKKESSSGVEIISWE